MKVNSFYILIFVALLGLLFATKRFYQGSNRSWVGIAVADDYTLSADKQAQVTSIHVVPGQTIKAGDTLIRLSSEQLMQDMEKNTSRINTLQREIQENRNLLNHEVELIKSSTAIDISDRQKEISIAESELKLNRQLQSNPNSTSTTWVSPLEEKVKVLKAEIELLNKTLPVKVSEVQARYQSQQVQIQNQIQLLQSEFALLQKDKNALLKIAATSGVVENVYVQRGEQINSFSPLLSVLPKNPISVTGYLETEQALPAIGTGVKVISSTNKNKTCQAKVIGYGAVTSLPDILQKATALKAFGKEIFIELPQQNEFSTGEKLLIRLWEN